jgi:hypothetical protein
MSSLLWRGGIWVSIAIGGIEVEVKESTRQSWACKNSNCANHRSYGQLGEAW